MAEATVIPTVESRGLTMSTDLLDPRASMDDILAYGRAIAHRTLEYDLADDKNRFLDEVVAQLKSYNLTETAFRLRSQELRRTGEITMDEYSRRRAAFMRVSEEMKAAYEILRGHITTKREQVEAERLAVQTELSSRIERWDYGTGGGVSSGDVFESAVQASPIVLQKANVRGGSPENLRELFQKAEQTPMFRQFYPRAYPSIGNYYSPKMFAGYLTGYTIHSAHVGLDATPTAMRLMLPGLAKMIEQKMPMLFVTSELLSAVLRTDFQDDIEWTEMKLPYEQGVLVLPKGALKAPGEDGDVGFIYWGRIRKGQHMSPALGIPNMETLADSFSIVALCPETGIMYDSNLTATYRPTLRLHNLFYRGEGEGFVASNDDVSDTRPSTLAFSPFDEQHLSEADAEFLERLGVVVFGTMLALRARPALLTPARLVTVAKNTKKGTRTEFWDPVYLGKGYYPQREKSTGTHASPRMHWRRGHFRHQAYGAGRLERKVIWLEPTLVSAKVEEAGNE